MKTITSRLVSSMLSLALLLSAFQLFAQNESRVVIIKEITNDDGSKTIEKEVITDTRDSGSDFKWPQDFHFNFDQDFNFHPRRDPCKVFIGVVTSQQPGEKLLVTEVIDGTPAKAAGIMPGDVILGLDGARVRTQNELVQERNKHNQGDPFQLQIIRNGAEQTIDAQFKACSEAEKAAYQAQKTHRIVINNDRVFRWDAERDPCAVFIGVYTQAGTSAEGEGVQVTGVLDNTPAQIYGVKGGDIILSVDGVPVNNYAELLRERNKHQAGDKFRLTVLRDGAGVDIDAQFKPCDKTNAQPPVVVEEEIAAPNQPSILQPGLDNVLQLQSLKVFPNPTGGPVNVRFEAEPVPTTVRIIDSKGRAVYSKSLNQFNGLFNEEVNLINNRPGNYNLVIEQNGRATTEKIVLLNRA